jgi:hypothetical protein
VFDSLGVDSPEQRDSLNRGGEYYKAIAFENWVTLEVNQYEWEDEYNYMISVGRDVLSKTQPSNEQIHSATDQISKLLQQSLKTRIAIEVNGELTIYEPN